ncbi:hypothetical protein JNUCC64_20320 [Streptomyces sp. JNUCC 64]
MKKFLCVVGWIVGVQGALGFFGPYVADRRLGLLPTWFDLPAAVYAGLLVVGVAVGLWGEPAFRKGGARP